MTLKKPKKRATARDVARHANVSVATVSRVLNGAVSVSAETSKRVHRSMDALRFVPSSAARAINSGRTHLVGALVPTLDHSIFAQYITALETALAEANLSLVVATTNNSNALELERAAKFLEVGVEGLFVTGLERDDGFSPLIQRYDVPTISTSLWSDDHAMPTIGYDNSSAARIALQHLAGLGHRDIVVLSSPLATSDRMRARVSGLSGLPDTRMQVIETELSHEGATQATAEALEHWPETTALLCLSDVLAQGALFQAQRMALSVPEHLSIIGLDGLASSASTTPSLTTVHLPVRRMGRAAGEAMAQWILTGQRPTHLRLDTTLIERQSTAKPRASQ